MPAATVTSKGQVTIPAEIRADFSIQPGDKITFFQTLDGRLGVHVKPRKAGSGRGMLSAKRREVSIEEMNPGNAPEGYDPGGLDIHPARTRGRAA